MSNIGDFLKKQREKNGLSLKDVQKKTGISNSVLSRIENDKKQSGASPIVLRSLSKLYGCSLIEGIVASVTGVDFLAHCFSPAFLPAATYRCSGLVGLSGIVINNCPLASIGFKNLSVK